MRGKFEGQNLLFIIMLALIVLLSYCSIPSKDKEQDPWEKAKIEHTKRAALQHDASVKETAAHGEAHETAAAEVTEAKEAVAEPVVEAPAHTEVAVAEVTHEKAETAGEEKVEAEETAEPAPPAEEDAEDMKKEVAAEEEAAEEAAPAVEETAAPVTAEEAAATETAEQAPMAAEEAGTVPDIMAMNNASYDHKKPIVLFTHKKHMTDYAVGCGECHHDDSGAPLADLKVGDSVEECLACHDKPGKAPSKIDNKKLTAAEKLEYHADALHQNCIKCHKEFNKKNNTKAAPASCGSCHDKDKTMPVAAPAAAEPAPAAVAESVEPAPVETAEENVEAAPAKADVSEAPAPETVTEKVAGESEPAETEEAPKAAADVATPEEGTAAPAETEAPTEADVPAEAEAPAPAEAPAAVEAPAPEAVSVQAPDVIPMENSAYEVHKKGIVQFTHKKHAADYGLGCGECHHDDSGAPLADLKAGDAVEGCIACHDKAGKAPKKKGEKLSREDQLAYHAEALHENCISCHKAFNKENNTKAAPTSCGKCHPKK